MIYIHVYSKLMKNKFEQKLYNALMLNYGDIIADDGYMETVCKRITAEMARLSDTYPNGKGYELNKFESAQAYVTLFGTEICNNTCCIISRKGSADAIIQVVSTHVMNDERVKKGGAK